MSSLSALTIRKALSHRSVVSRWERLFMPKIFRAHGARPHNLGPVGILRQQVQRRDEYAWERAMPAIFRAHGALPLMSLRSGALKTLDQPGLQLFQLGGVGLAAGMGVQPLLAEARNHVHMDMEHRLPGRRTVELGDLHAIGL